MCWWSDFGLSVKKIIIIILMTNMFIKLSLNSKILITTSSKETAGTPAEVRVKLPCFLFKLLGQLMWLEQNLGNKLVMCCPLRHSPGFIPENLGKESEFLHFPYHCDSLFCSTPWQFFLHKYRDWRRKDKEESPRFASQTYGLLVPSTAALTADVHWHSFKSLSSSELFILIN